jgi:Cft2 family RNA processing exonuclease
MARHVLALCTPETAKLYHHRLGMRDVLALPYRKTVEFGGVRITAYPAGHCLGSAMLHVEEDDRTLLYTGDFKLSESVTSERAELPHADILVIESTYGTPSYRLPPRADAIAQLFEAVQGALDVGRVPVVQAYALGKSQEVTRILTDAGFPVQQHPAVYEVSQVYEACGVLMGACTRYDGKPLPGHVVVVPPQFHKQRHVAGLNKIVKIAVTGWAHDESTRWRLRVDHAIPLSDHADYDELLETVERVAPREVHCTHGPESFVDRLRELGHNAHRLGARQQQAQLPGM